MSWHRAASPVLAAASALRRRRRSVLKNTGSICAKSPSACIRSIRTEPTIPRQPTKPVSTVMRCPVVERNPLVRPASSPGQLGKTNRSLLALGASCSREAATTASPISRVPTCSLPSAPDVGGAQPCGEHGAHRRLDAVGGFGPGKLRAQHHRRGEDRRQRIGLPCPRCRAREPWIGSYRPLSVASSERGDGSMPIEPVTSPPGRRGCRRTGCR